MSIGSKIKAVRNNRKLTQEDFSQKIGISRSNLAQIENGHTKPTYDTLNAISKQFHIDSNYFFDVTEDVSLNVKINNPNFVTDLVTESVTEGYKNTRNSQYLKEKVLISEKMIEDIYSKAFATESFGIKAIKLQELATSYNKRLSRELQINHKNLFSVMQLTDNLDALIELVWEAISDNLNNKPNPFELTQYLDIQDKKEYIPENLNYEAYKNDVISWLNKIDEFKETIQDYYNRSELFLQQIKEMKSTH